MSGRRVSANEYARHCDVAPGTVIRWIKQGRLEGAVKRDGRRWSIELVKADAIRNKGVGHGRILEAEKRRRKQRGLDPLTPEEEARILHTGSLEPDPFGHRARRVAEGKEPVQIDLDGEAVKKGRAAQEVYKGLMAELEYRQAAGELVYARDVARRQFEIMRRVWNSVFAMVPDLQEKFAAISDPHAIGVRWTQELTDLFTALANELEGGARGTGTAD